MELRPKVKEVVACLGQAKASWKGVMPPRPQVVQVADTLSQETESDLGRFREFEILIVP